MIQYDEDYFIRGKEKGLSLYEDYRWLPDLTIPMAERMVRHLGIKNGETIMDFGCARGYLVKALSLLGHYACGLDVSEWAIRNCDPEVKNKVALLEPGKELPVYDWIIAKDVLEHIDYCDVINTLHRLSHSASRGVFVIVPLAGIDGKYVVEEYEKDVTHKIRWHMLDWVAAFYEAFDNTWEISARHRIKGIKDNYSKWKRGNGFITARKI